MLTQCFWLLLEQNGFNGVRTSAALDCKWIFFSFALDVIFLYQLSVNISTFLLPIATSSSSTQKPESPSLVSSTSVAPSAPLSLLPPSVTPHSSTLSSLAPELPSTTLPSLSR